MDIDSYIKNATLSKDRVALNAYKNLKAEIQKVLTAKNAPKELSDELQISIFSKYAKKLEDAISQFSEAHRDDLVSEYTSELEVVKKLLPEPVNESDIWNGLVELGVEKDWINAQEFFNSVGNYQVIYIPKKEMGSTIKYLKSKFPTADGKMISEIVKKYIV